MTTKSERKFIYDLYSELKVRTALARKMMNDSAKPFHPGFGAYDDEEHDKEQRIRDKAYDCAEGAYETCDAIWNFVMSKYTKWDIELAIQENEERIGELKYER